MTTSSESMAAGATRAHAVTAAQREKVVILSPFFFPEPISTGKYNGNMAAALVEHGAEVVAVCSHPLYPAWKPEVAKQEMPGVSAYRGGARLRYPASALARRAVLELWYAWHVLCAMLSVARNANRIVAVFPPSLFMLVAAWLRPKNAQVIGIVHDLQGVYAARKSGMLGRMLQGAISAVERRAFLSCDHLVFLSETMRDVTLKAYNIDRSRTSVQYPFVTLPEQRADAATRLAATFPSDLKTLVYSGALGEKQAPFKLLSLMVAILDRFPDWQARVYSEGPIFEQLRQQFRHPRLVFNPLVPVEDLPELLERSDVQVIPQEVNTSDGSLPSKLPNIMAACTRLLCITDPGSELQAIVSRYPGGVACTTWDVPQGVDAFARLTQLARPQPDLVADVLSQFTLSGLVRTLMIKNDK